MIECYDENCQFKDMPHVHAFSENEDPDLEDDGLKLISEAFKEAFKKDDFYNAVELLPNGDLMLSHTDKPYICFVPKFSATLI